MKRIIQVLLITSTIAICVTLSKQVTGFGGKATAIFAKPRTMMIDEINLDKLKPGESITSNFKVTNHNENQISDVPMLYKISIKTENYLPLKFELREIVEGNVETENLLKNGQTEEIELPISKCEREYQITVTWDETEKNYLYSSEIDSVKIVIDSYQKSV